MCWHGINGPVKAVVSKWTAGFYASPHSDVFSFFPLSPSEVVNVWKPMGWLPWPFTQPWLWHCLILILSPSFLPTLVVVWPGSGILLWATLARNQQGVFLRFRFLLVSSWIGLLQDPTKHRCYYEGGGHRSQAMGRVDSRVLREAGWPPLGGSQPLAVSRTGLRLHT